MPNTLRNGDYFCTTSVGDGGNWRAKLLSSAIRKLSKMRSPDNQALYTHAGIMCNPQGDTFEARWRYDNYHIDDYIGGRVVIGRAQGMSPKHHIRAMLKLSPKYKGRMYPFWRLVMFMVPLMPRLSLTHLPVCSELTAMHMMMCGIPTLRKWVGLWENRTPDDISDMLHKWDVLDVVYEGVWPGLDEWKRQGTEQ